MASKPLAPKPINLMQTTHTQVRELHKELVAATNGQGFLLMGGDCAESFDEFNVDHVRDSFRVILQMALILTYGGALPITKVGRMAGQFAKPRSDPDETRDGITLPSYRGDIINGEGFTAIERENDPYRMVAAYHQSAQTLNILRAFASGGYADMSRLHAWNLDFVEQVRGLQSPLSSTAIRDLHPSLPHRRSPAAATAAWPPRWTRRCVS